MNYKQIGQRIRQTRKRKKLSQAVLAEKADLSVSYISHLENAIKIPSLETIVRIANALDVTVDQILIGNQLIEGSTYTEELLEIVKGCNQKERQFVMDMMSSIVVSLKRNQEIFSNIDQTTGTY